MSREKGKQYSKNEAFREAGDLSSPWRYDTLVLRGAYIFFKIGNSRENKEREKTQKLYKKVGAREMEKGNSMEN